MTSASFGGLSGYLETVLKMQMRLAKARGINWKQQAIQTRFKTKNSSTESIKSRRNSLVFGKRPVSSRTGGDTNRIPRHPNQPLFEYRIKPCYLRNSLTYLAPSTQQCFSVLPNLRYRATRNEIPRWMPNESYQTCLLYYLS